MDTLTRVLLLVGASIFLFGAIGAAAQLQSPLSSFSGIALATAALLAVLGAGLASLPRHSRDDTVRRLGLGPGRLAGWSLAALCLGTVGLSHALDAAIDWAQLEDVGVLPELRAALEGARGAPLIVAWIAIAVGAGIGEEIFFRGWLQRGLARGLARFRAGPHAAIALAALAFGALHMDPVQSPAAFALGLYLGAAAWLAGSTRAAVACHVVNNTAAVLAAAWSATLPIDLPTRIAAGAILAAGGLAAALVARPDRVVSTTS